MDYNNDCPVRHTFGEERGGRRVESVQTCGDTQNNIGWADPSPKKKDGKVKGRITGRCSRRGPPCMSFY